jgi:hypothetical protein
MLVWERHVCSCQSTIHDFWASLPAKNRIAPASPGKL